MSSSEDPKARETGEAQPEGTSRRDFLKGAFAATATMSLAGVLAGCETDSAPVSEPATGPANEVDYPVQVHDSDVLVIGAGIAGCSSAVRAMSFGKSVTIVDKGPYGRSGTSGMNWGHGYSTPEFSQLGDATAPTMVGQILFSNEGMAHQDYAMATVQAALEMRPSCYGEQLGMLTERLRDGESIGHNAPRAEGQVTTSVYGWFPRFIAQHARRVGAKIVDKTMVIDILQSEDGSAAGAVAIDLATGDAHVFRAKSIIMATGCFNWICGWNDSLSPWSIAGPEATGDGTGMFLKLGLDVSNLEFTPHDSPPVFPLAFRQCMGLAFEFPDYYVAENSEGTYFVNDHFTAIPSDIGQGTLTRLTAREPIQGRGNEWGGVWMNTTNVLNGERFYRRWPEQMKRHFNYEIPEKVPVAPEFWGTYATPDPLSVTSETKIPGLWYAGAAFYGFNLPGGLACGWLAGKGAADRATSIDRLPISWTQVNDSLKRAYGALEAEPASPIRARQVQRNIQKGYGKGLLLVRNESGIKSAIEEMERVRAEDIPNMFVPSKSRHFNIDWRNALEVPYMANVGIAAGYAALERKECRMVHIREDYPPVDNENYLKKIGIKLEGDKFTVSSIEIDTSISPVDTIKQMLPTTSIDFDEPTPALPFTPLPDHVVE
jgi:succinate dehydrogenase / fumarate reductase flavoprotein subunit